MLTGPPLASALRESHVERQIRSYPCRNVSPEGDGRGRDTCHVMKVEGCHVFFQRDNFADF